MENITLDSVYNLLNKLFSKVNTIELEIKEMKDEMGLEVRPEYIENLDKISKQKGDKYNSMEEFDEAFGVK
tara:strand:+ start:195 stop:407 length:213 start_codon:yes stop_codon:yes gene_type:complete